MVNFCYLKVLYLKGIVYQYWIVIDFGQTLKLVYSVYVRVYQNNQFFTLVLPLKGKKGIGF